MSILQCIIDTVKIKMEILKVKSSHYRPMGSEGCGRLRLPDSVTSALEGGR
jgi:hypothetical protein